MSRPALLGLALALPLTAAASLTAAVLTAPAAHADERVCRGSIGASSIDGDVVVPRDATCRLNGTRVDGNVLVRDGATLVARGVRVGGNVQAEGHEKVVVRPRTVDDRVVRSAVGGSVQLKQGGGGLLLRTVVDSDIQLFSNDARFTVRRNAVDGNLQCKGNDPAPVGGGNAVQGEKENQCADL
jgi:hypothetical protein